MAQTPNVFSPGSDVGRLEPAFLAVGRMSLHKNQLGLIKALRRVSTRR